LEIEEAGIKKRASINRNTASIAGRESKQANQIKSKQRTQSVNQSNQGNP
jgi:hypothetical protein